MIPTIDHRRSPLQTIRNDQEASISASILTIEKCAVASGHEVWRFAGTRHAKATAHLPDTRAVKPTTTGHASAITRCLTSCATCAQPNAVLPDQNRDNSPKSASDNLYYGQESHKHCVGTQITWYICAPLDVESLRKKQKFSDGW